MEASHGKTIRAQSRLKQYGQRSQSETVHSMVKRNQGSALRSRTPQRRKQEMLLRVLTHNIMLLAEQESEE